MFMMTEQESDYLEAGAAPASQNALLSALVALLADQREADAERTTKRKTEVLLADAGLRPAQIGPILGKRPDTVRVAITRARQAATKDVRKRSLSSGSDPSDG
jgi:DNA-directed RNA polymerase specialized sigma24 family protein